MACGDALWISCGTWIAFWNGVIGASFAAIAGAIIALVVVRLTNSQQRRGVDRAIEVAAVADFVAASSELEWALIYRMEEPEYFDAGAHILLMRSALSKLQMSRQEMEGTLLLMLLWPEKLHTLTIMHSVSEEHNLDHARDILEAFSEIVTAILLAMPLYVSRDKEKHDTGVKSLRETDKKIIDALKRFDGLMREKLPNLPTPPWV